ncbi:MAG: AI-2E family transporter [Candidatus Sumerlaeota bacterium]|nr:AI-2E family transporter [Candidatus Sumerlaeota bacterium]
MPFNVELFYQHNRRIMTWLIFVALLWMMRPYFGLIFLTFVFGFVAASLVGLCQRFLRLPRRMAIVTVYVCFLAALTSFVSIVVPQVGREAGHLIKNLDKIEKSVNELKDSIDNKYPALGQAITGYLRGAIPATEGAPDDGSIGLPPDDESIGLPQDEDVILIRRFIQYLGSAINDKAPSLLKAFGGGSFTMLLALLFSFLISMDLARLTQTIESLKLSRLSSFYEQTAAPVIRFGVIVGRAMQAQAMIACVNTALTLIGLIIFGIPSLTMLSLIVFLCSFIPVLGVFISTTPLVLVALNAGGVNLAVLAISLVVFIHIIEAYLLNPIIYGHHLKLNPVLVLIILYVGHHTFGIWGMLLGVPVAYYFIYDVFGVPIWQEKALATKIAGPPVASPPQTEQPASPPAISDEDKT